MAGQISGKYRKDMGFTLIELLVVISIIALLVSILLPSLNRAKGLARGVVCLSNVRRLSLAGQFYLSANRDVFPPVRMKYKSDGSTYVNAYGRSKPRWQWFFDQGVGPAIDPPVSNQTFGDSETRTMTNDYFMCPSLQGPYDRDIRNGAYGYNYQYLGDSRSVRDGRYTNFPVRATLIRSPGQTVLLGDSRGGDAEHGMHSYTLDPPKLAASQGVEKFGPTAGKDGPIGHSPAEARHVGRAGVAFVDGHAESLMLTALGYELDDSQVVIPGRGDNRLWAGTRKDEEQSDQ